MAPRSPPRVIRVQTTGGDRGCEEQREREREREKRDRRKADRLKEVERRGESVNQTIEKKISR